MNTRPINLALLVVTLATGVYSSCLLAQTDVFEFSPSEPLSFSETLLEEPSVEPRALKPSVALVFVENADHIPANAGLVDRAHIMVSRGFRKFFHRIDGFFSDGGPSVQGNQSWARVRVDTIKSAAVIPRSRASVKLRVVLPRTEQRLRLLFSTDDEQVQSTTSQGSEITDADDNGFSLALRFIRKAKEEDLVNFDLGTRYRDSRAQLFGRINLLYRHDLRWGFRSSFRNSFYYFTSSGFENKFRYDIKRPLNESESMFFRGSTELRWREDQRGTLVGETVGVYTDIDANRAVAVEALASYTTELNDEQTEKFLGAEVRLRFRHNIWRRWFYYEIWPTLRWSPVNDYEPSLGGLFRLEVILGSV